MATKRTTFSTERSKGSRQQDLDPSLIKQIELAVLEGAGGTARLKEKIPILLRTMMDEVIDSPRTGRSTLDETRIDERIYLATKVRILLRNLLGLPKGEVLDASVCGTEVGIQSTIHERWSVPSRLAGCPCVLIKTDEKNAICSVGISVIRAEAPNESGEPFARRVISSSGIQNISWVFKDEPLPRVFSRSSRGLKKPRAEFVYGIRSEVDCSD